MDQITATKLKLLICNKSLLFALWHLTHYYPGNNLSDALGTKLFIQELETCMIINIDTDYLYNQVLKKIQQ